MATDTLWLEHRHNNAYDTILLVCKDEADTYVVGAWTTDRGDKVWADYQSPGDLRDWAMTSVDEQDPDAYGDLVSATEPVPVI
jgi:hypothetical protein